MSTEIECDDGQSVNGHGDAGGTVTTVSVKAVSGDTGPAGSTPHCADIQTAGAEVPGGPRSAQQATSCGHDTTDLTRCHCRGRSQLEGADDLGREPSFTAMWHAWLRNRHATAHASPILTDTRSVQLVPEQLRDRVASVMGGFSSETADAIVLVAVVRHRVLADRLAEAHERGVRQLVILGAGLDTTAFSLPAWGDLWQVFEVDHLATQEWKRRRIEMLGWERPRNVVFVPCDFEVQKLLSALDAAGFQRGRPALVSLFGVVLYLTRSATAALFSELASLTGGSEVLMTYSPPSDGTDPVVEEVWERASPVVDSTGESFVGYYSESEMERLVREAGFRDAIQHPNDVLNARYLAGRPDGLCLHPIERLLTAVP